VRVVAVVAALDLRPVATPLKPRAAPPTPVHVEVSKAHGQLAAAAPSATAAQQQQHQQQQQQKLLRPFEAAPPTAARPSTGAPKLMTPAPPSAAFDAAATRAAAAAVKTPSRPPTAVSVSKERRTATGVVSKEFKAPDDTQVGVVTLFPSVVLLLCARHTTPCSHLPTLHPRVESRRARATGHPMQWAGDTPGFLKQLVASDAVGRAPRDGYQRTRLDSASCAA